MPNLSLKVGLFLLDNESTGTCYPYGQEPAQGLFVVLSKDYYICGETLKTDERAAYFSGEQGLGILAHALGRLGIEN